MNEATRFPAVITFRTDDATKNLIDKAARAEGTTAGVFCRSVILRQVGAVLDLPRVRRAIANRDELRRLLGELGRQGNLLNQCARKLNNGATPTAVAADFAAIRAAYETTMADLVVTLGVGRDP